MMTTNKLTKTFASGSLAIGVLAGAVLTATSANAAMLSWADWTSGTPLIEGDKKVTYVSGSIGAEAVDDVALIEMGDDYYFIYDAMNGPATANANSGSFTYTIEATTPGWYIVGVDLDSNVSSNYGTVTETFGEIPGLELISTNGSPVPDTGFIGIAPYHLLTVTNTLVANPNEGLFDFQNSFHQVYKPVPEPGTILGLLAVGGLGLVSRFKKQK
ncbi:MAG: PEP-CTERM sorting domain-containing protein [Microcystis sp. LE19-338.1B]|jgi:hypothetical protein|nr:PEP-CTERM sorting domain-containing protein [Microcystis sp. LE19-338.1B]